VCATWTAFVIGRCVVNFALNGEWSLGSMLVAETWPARLRGRVIGINRGTWCFGAALAGVIATFVIANYGWRFAFAVPAVIALAAVYVRAKCPESPYWVRMQDRKARIAHAQSVGLRLSAEDADYVMLAEGAVFITLWVYATTDTELWIYGLLWSVGFLGFWGPSMILTAEVFPTRIRGIGNGFAWSVAWVFGFVLWPFLAVGLQQRTGSFAAAFLLIPAAMACMAIGVWWFTPEHAGRDLDQIAT
jgi:MFS family permease